VKKLFLPTAAAAALAIVSLFVHQAVGQNNAAPAADAVGPHKVGVIDMAHIFKHYQKFETLREDLKAEIEQSEQDAKAQAVQLKGLQDQMKDFKEGSPEAIELEQKIAKGVSDFEAYRKVAQRDFLRKESQLYKQIYLEVLDAVKLYADHYKYTLIVRFNREDLASVDNPQQVLERMNQQIVFHNDKIDITEAILNYLNGKYKPTTSAQAPAQQNRRAQ
jgi:outer membrane protein